MQWFQALVMGVVEGITEFLPISSTGHMILVSKILGISDSEFVKSFEIVVQLGAILAVVFIYLRKVWAKKEWWGKLIVAFLATGVVGSIFYKIVKQYFLGNDLLVAATLFVGGIVLILFEKYFAKKINGQKTIGQLSLGQAVLIGLAQTLSIVPGVSRSMATIFGGMGVKLSREEAVEFAFLLAVPTMVAASGLDLLKTGFNYSLYDYQMLGIGLVGAFVSAWVVVKMFVKYVQTHDLSIFGWYRIVIAIAYLLLVR